MTEPKTKDKYRAVQLVKTLYGNANLRLMIQVHFANYSDKEEVLRKSKLLKGGTIHISEDFSRKVFFSEYS